MLTVRPADSPPKYARRCVWRIFGSRFHAYMHSTTRDRLHLEWCMFPAKVRYSKQWVDRGVARLNEHANGWPLPEARYKERDEL